MQKLNAEVDDMHASAGLDPDGKGALDLSSTLYFHLCKGFCLNLLDIWRSTWWSNPCSSLTAIEAPND